MRAVLGIGNPGSKYANTRHNAGFLLIDKLAQDFSIPFRPSKGEYYAAGGTCQGSAFTLIKPTTYVNASGSAALHVLSSYALLLDDFLVVYDDINLPIGTVRIRFGGGDGGHNGIASILEALPSDRFPRLRIGIGDSFPKGMQASYVLQPFSPQEFPAVQDALSFASQLAKAFISGGLKVMQDENSRLASLKKTGSNDLN